jgi:hypothetical protein
LERKNERWWRIDDEEKTCCKKEEKKRQFFSISLSFCIISLSELVEKKIIKQRSVKNELPISKSYQQ